MWSSTSFPLGVWALVICAAVGSVVADGLNPISKPAAGQTVPVGQPINIKWSPGTPGPVSIKLLVNSNAQMGNITSSTTNNGSFLWTPNSDLAVYNEGQNYFLQICDLNTKDCTYTSSGRISFGNSTTTSSTTSSSSSSLSSSTTTRASATSPIASSSSTSSATTSSLASTSQTTSSSPAPSSSGGGGLSTTAQIAIGVVVSILGTVTLLVGAFIILKRRKKRRIVPEKPVVLKPELSGEGARIEPGSPNERQWLNTYELPLSRNRYELPISGNRYELQSGENAYELPGGADRAGGDSRRMNGM